MFAFRADKQSPEAKTNIHNIIQKIMLNGLWFCDKLNAGLVLHKMRLHVHSITNSIFKEYSEV